MTEEHPIPTDPRFKDLTGKTFNSLTVISFACRRGRSMRWMCLCTCGRTKEITAGSIVGGHTKSCGCKQIRTKHGNAAGGRQTPEYGAWAKMIDRCVNDRNPHWHNYGGRGIKVCDEWIHDFAAFLAYVGPRPSPKHSLDRFPDNNGNYAPGNVRWATWKEQHNNRRNNNLVTFNGKTQCLTAWAEETGIPNSTLRGRLSKNWPIEIAMTEPPSRSRSRHLNRAFRSR